MVVPRVIVYPPDPEDHSRMVRYDGVILGRAFKVSDLREFIRAAGGDPDDFDLTDPTLFDWRGGGPQTWAESPP
ncbi:hypothetical protein ACFWUZ_19910 [Streptomyces sp. NPDC058646]|uniref:hypothetical protein n=1 Tax=Streptomyces sp. NPDC058646 TaxID=3346574 RepID=UPI0036690866